MATFGGISQQKRQLPDGRWEISKHYSSGNVESTVGNVDESGRFEGPVKITYEDDNYIVTHTEDVDMKDGERHGLSRVTYPDGRVRQFCYQYGERVKMSYCEEKSATIAADDHTAYDIFSYGVPWFEFKLDACGFDSSYMKAYLDTLESVLYTSVFGETEFEDYYDDVVDELEETPYDSIIQFNAELSIHNGLNMILSHEFRLATLYSYMKSDSNTYHVVTSVYPNYLLALNEQDVTDDDFEGFCRKYDSIMSSWDPIDPEDPYLMDSLDARMYRTMDSIYSGEKSSSKRLESLKSATRSNKLRTFRSFRGEYLSRLKPTQLSKTPSEVAEVVLFSILENFLHGDLIRTAVREAFLLKNSIVSIPTVVTLFSGNNSSTSVTLNGNVVKDGGGEITSRGMAWGSIYNPTTDNQVVSAGTGTGDFETTITGLTEGETYYARAYATNSAGTAYGNCISFVAQSTIGTDLRESNSPDLKIYPNPASDHLTLSFNTGDPEGVVFTMFDLNGRIVLRKELSGVVQGVNAVSLDLSGIQDGIYTCRITGEEKMFAAQKLVIKR